MTTKTTIKYENKSLYLKYPNQTSQQKCFIELDLEDGELNAGTNPSIGSGTPMRVWNGIVKRWNIPCLKPKAVIALLKEIQPLAEEIMEGSSIFWDGKNYVGKLTEEAQEIVEKIDCICSATEFQEEDIESHWNAWDWYAPISDVCKELGITAESTDENLDKIAAREQEAAEEQGYFVESILEYLSQKRDELQNDN